MAQQRKSTQLYLGTTNTFPGTTSIFQLGNAEPRMSRLLKQNVPGDALTSMEGPRLETGTLFAKDQKIQGDLEESSDLEESEYSFQTAMELLEENQKALKLTSQKAQNNDKEKQQHEEMQETTTDTPTSSFSSDNETESMDAKCPTGYLDMEGTSSLRSEASTNEQLEQPSDQQVTGAHLELERMRWHFVLAKLKCEQEDKEKQRLHEERMEQIRHQAAKGSVNEGLQNLLQPSNQYALFLYCFVIIHVIYTLKELAFYIFQTHYLFCFTIVLFYILKRIFQDYRNNNKYP